MTARECPACRQMSRDGHLCHKCLRATKTALRRISDLWPTLQETITRQDRTAPPAEGHTQTIHGPVPFNGHASAVAKRAHTRLGRWTRVAVDTFAAPSPTRDTVPAICTTLLAAAGQMRKHPGAVNWRRDITTTLASIEQTVDLADRRAIAGPCPDTTEDGEPCPGVIVAVYPVDEDTRPHMDCTPPRPDIDVCGKTWPPEAWATLGARIKTRQAQIEQQTSRTRRDIPAGIYLTPPVASATTWQEIGEASVTFGIPLSTIEKWIADGLATCEQVDDDGQITAILVDTGRVAWLEWCGRTSGPDAKIGA